MKVYSIYDGAVKAFMRPFMGMSHGDAIRAFKDLASDAQHPVGKHPEDYSLFHVGHFDDQTGLLTGETAPHSLGNALEYVAAAQQMKAVNDA